MNKTPTSFSGIGGYLWFNGLLLATLKSFEAKITGNFDDLVMCGSPATYSVYKGYTGEGTLVLHKVNSEVLKLVAPAYKDGNMPDIKLISKHENKGTGKSERISFSEIAITEVMLAKFAAGEVTEESVPFKFADYDILAA